MSEKFEREERYIVFKVKDLSQHKLGWVRDVIRLNGIPTVDAVVVESDWPEYEPTWAAIERRVTGAPAWVGVGLPPVGTVCEVQDWANGDTPLWRETKILAHHLGFAIESSTQDGEDMEVSARPAGDFRPIRTPEQIAEEERAAAIKEMRDTLQGGRTGTDWATYLYDAGYRKQVAP
ncbi:hypothetical protein [Pseudomonas sp. PNPG3]|uniref:hypothetical protein n=1 Tax=Pseudomonas sp. PNPG3 TaxID=2919497 RepID=UPI001FFCB904|nr:hypothetical protein [Pseudomonas sp. PNPG3]MCK2123860.1 hypothetical protein [Pseudomonas sp. PNPG3]